MPDAQAASPSVGTPPQHPLDPLTADELRLAVALTRDHPQFNERLRFASVALQEPAKEIVYQFKTGARLNRAAFLCLFDYTEGLVYEVIVSLSQGAVTSWRPVPGVCPPLLIETLI